MKTKTRILIVVLALGILIPAIVFVLWQREANREKRMESLAEQALTSGDWEQAAVYAEQAGDDSLRFEAVYQSAEQLLANGDYAQAEQAFLSLGAYSDAQNRVKECRYGAANALFRAGDDEGAAEAFFALIPYADSLDRYRDCRYRTAERLLTEGDTYAAFAAFEALIPYADCEARATEIALQLTGETDPQRAIAFAKGYSEEDWLRKEQLFTARSAVTRGRIAVGNEYAVFLFADGHAEAVGEGAQGQCNVAAFRNVKAVAAGYLHTLGLKEDGTVVAAGDNRYEQCSVADWTDVVSIACGAWDSFGVRADGTLLHCGFSTYDLTGWTELAAVFACETALIGMRQDGTLLCTAAEGRFPGSFCDAAITTGTAFALTEEGTVRCENDEVAAWHDIAAITNSASVLIGICADGSLLTHPLIPCDRTYLNALAVEQNVAEVAAGGSFAVVLHRDGTLSGCGALPPAVAEFLAHTPSL